MRLTTQKGPPGWQEAGVNAWNRLDYDSYGRHCLETFVSFLFGV